MAMDPRDALTLASAIRDLYARAETDVLVRVARRAARGIEQPGWAEAKAAELGALRVELDRVIAELDVTGPEQAAQLIERAHRAGAAAAADVLGQPVMVAVNRAGVESLLASTVTRLQGTHLPILRTATDAYRAVIAEASGFTATGSFTRRQAAAMALSRFADRGVSGFVDSRGRNWELASYTEMATRSAVNQARVDGHLGQLAARGRDLVRVSDSPDECKLCRPWEGRILSISGLDPNHPALSEARAGGLFHSTCTHGVAPWIPGLSRPFGRTADPAGEQERARHRSNERQIRRWKRREETLTAFGDEHGAQQAAAKVATWQAEQRRFIAKTGRRRDYRREGLGGAR